MDARISGSVELRPIRVGLLIPRDSAEALRQAISIASASWGGVYFPIFEWATDEDDRRILEESVELGIDVLLPCTSDEPLVRLARTPGFEWLGFGDLPFTTEHSYRFVDLDTILTARRRANEAPTYIPYPSWDADDPLALLFAVMFGHLGDDGEFGRLADELSRVTPPLRIGSTDPLPGDLAWLVGPLAVGSWRSGLSAEWRDAGVAVLDPRSVGDLVGFWNLRAAGNIIAPWAVGHEDRLEALVGHSLANLPDFRWGERSNRRVTTFVRSYEEDLPEGLAKLLPSDPEVDRVRAMWGVRYGPRSSAMTSSFTTQFDLPVTGTPATGLSIRVPLPQTELRVEARGLPLKHCALRIHVYGERELPERVSFRAPASELFLRI